MKKFFAIILFSFWTFSFLVDAGIFSVDKKASVEQAEEVDADKIVKQKIQKVKYACLPSFAAINFFQETAEIKTMWAAALSNISYEVENRPPRV